MVIAWGGTGVRFTYIHLYVYTFSYKDMYIHINRYFYKNIYTGVFMHKTVHTNVYVDIYLLRPEFRVVITGGGSGD